MRRLATMGSAILFVGVAPALSQSLGDRLRGMSIQVRTTMSMVGLSSRGPFSNPNVRTMKLYVSTKGRLFDYTEAGYKDDSGADRLSGGSKIVALGERWEAGTIGQQWDVAAGGLLRTRYYPWGQQVYRIAIAPNLRTCSVRGTMISTRPDGKFFFYDAHDNQPNEVLSHGADTGSCTIARGNVFATADE